MGDLTSDKNRHIKTKPITPAFPSYFQHVAHATDTNNQPIQLNATNHISQKSNSIFI